MQKMLMDIKIYQSYVLQVIFQVCMLEFKIDKSLVLQFKEDLIVTSSGINGDCRRFIKSR